MSVHILLHEPDDGGTTHARTAEVIRAAAAPLGIACTILRYTELDTPALAAVVPGDVVVACVDLRSDEDLVVATELLWALGRRGVVCIPTAVGLVASEDRLRTFVRMRQAGVPTPSTVAICATGSRLEDLASLQARLRAFPVLVKRPVGSGGRGVWRCDGPESLVEVLVNERDSRPEGAVLVQPYVEHGRRLSVRFASGRVLSSSCVDSGSSDAVPFVLTPELILLSLSAADACELRFGVVEFLLADGAKPTCVRVRSLPDLSADSPDDRAFAAAILEAAAERP